MTYGLGKQLRTSLIALLDSATVRGRLWGLLLPHEVPEQELDMLLAALRDHEKLETEASALAKLLDAEPVDPEACRSALDTFLTLVGQHDLILGHEAVYWESVYHFSVSKE